MRLTGAPNAISVSSCNAGMFNLFALGYGPGDEVIVWPKLIATAHAVELTGAKPVFIDSENETGNIDINLIESAINSKTKAIAVVHYLGAPVNMPKILEIEKYDLFVLEDCIVPRATIDGIYWSPWRCRRVFILSSKTYDNS